jgi:hypothetical protein
VTSWTEKLNTAKAEIAAGNAEHPWKLPLGRLKGKVDYDGLERVTTQAVLDILEVPQSKRKAGTYRLLARLMAELDWAAVRVRDLTRGGYKEQIRGYARDARHDHRSRARDEDRALGDNTAAMIV